jgi:hypothetical protein
LTFSSTKGEGTKTTRLNIAIKLEAADTQSSKITSIKESTIPLSFAFLQPFPLLMLLHIKLEIKWHNQQQRESKQKGIKA